MSLNTPCIPSSVNTTSAASTLKLAPGLQNPVVDAQRIFRRALKAMSEPGTLVDIHQASTVANLSPAMFGLILALLDQQTPLYLASDFAQREIIKNLQFHCGVKIVNAFEDAQFVLDRADKITDLQRFNSGTDESPEMSCSLLLQVSEFGMSDQSESTQLSLTGPGIQSAKTVQIANLSAALLEYLTQRSGAFPRGLDCFFVSDHQLLCIPRSTQVKVI